MKTTRASGFVLTLVIVAMTVLGVIIGVLGVGAKAMLFQADAAQTQAVERNLAASGLAWAQHRIEQGDIPAPHRPVALDVGAFGGRETHLSVCFTNVEPKTVDVQIEGSFVKSRHLAKATGDYTLPRTRQPDRPPAP